MTPGFSSPVHQRILIFGGAGFLGRALVEKFWRDNEIYVCSRDEAKHFYLKQSFPNVKCHIVDVRDYGAIYNAIKHIDPTIVINAAALKQVPVCEDYPYEAVKTIVLGTQNIVQAVEDTFDASEFQEERKILSVSTDKACKPVNSYGMAKALQERLHLRGKGGIYSVVRYGNVLSSTGSVIPFFKKRIQEGKSLPITHPEMTRFLLADSDAVELIEKALSRGRINGIGNIYIPKIKSCKIVDLAIRLCEYYNYDRSHIEMIKIRPGEKIHEILISEEECIRTEEKTDKYVIHDILDHDDYRDVIKEYSSSDCVMTHAELEEFLINRGVLTCEL